MDREIVCDSLILWVETFNLEVPHTTAEELSDGIAMSKVLHQIASDYFTEAWLHKIKRENPMNWRLKVSNLKKILKGILEYNLEVLGIQIHDFQMPDVNAIGEHCDRGELGRLLQLILGCAVNCSDKQEYIQRIMAMEESVQHVVMTAIQELMTKEIASGVDSEVGDQLKRTLEELNGALEAKEELMQRCHELDLQVTSLMEEKQNLQLENERISDRLNQAENLDDPEFSIGGNTPAGKRFQQIQNQLDQLQEENYKLESAKDDYRIKVDVLQKEANDLKEKNADLHSLADECRGLKDELDVLRHTSEQVVKYEAQIESYKKKMEDLSDLRGQVKLLEDKNTKYMQENLELQEEVRRSATLKQQLEVYKRQGLEQQSKITEETKRADKAEFEAKRMQEKVATLQREKERLAADRDSLQEINDELKLTQAQHVGGGEAGLSTSLNMEMLSLPPEMREKLLRLEHENKMLKLKDSGDTEDNSQVIQDMLDVANSRKNELETELRLANQKTMELEAQIEDMQEMAKSTVSSSELIELRKKLDEQVSITQQKDRLVQKERENVTEIQNQLKTQTEEVEKLRELIEVKDEEKRSLTEKYKKYFDKARSVISTQEQKLKSSGNYYPDLQALKQQLQEKDRYIEQLLKDQEKTKNVFEQEEKMMVSAWNNLAIQLNRQGAIDRLENSQGQAFLSRQRQVHLRGQQRIPNSHPNPSSEIDLCPDLPPNQSTDGDGCFTSLFECVLTQLQQDTRAGGSYLNIPCDLDRKLALQPSDQPPQETDQSPQPTDIQRRLIAYILGSNIGNCSGEDLGLNKDQCSNQIEVEEAEIDDKENKEKPTFIGPLTKSAAEVMKDCTKCGFNKRLHDRIVPETPDYKPKRKHLKRSVAPFSPLFENDVESKTPLLDVPNTNVSDTGNIIKSPKTLSEGDVTKDMGMECTNEEINESESGPEVNSDKENQPENLHDRTCTSDVVNSSFNSFFAKLDEFPEDDNLATLDTSAKSNSSLYSLLGGVDEATPDTSFN